MTSSPDNKLLLGFEFLETDLPSVLAEATEEQIDALTLLKKHRGDIEAAVREMQQGIAARIVAMAAIATQTTAASVMLADEDDDLEPTRVTGALLQRELRKLADVVDEREMHLKIVISFVGQNLSPCRALH